MGFLANVVANVGTKAGANTTTNSARNVASHSREPLGSCRIGTLELAARVSNLAVASLDTSAPMLR